MTIETKFNIGDEVWAIMADKAFRCVVEHVYCYHGRYILKEILNEKTSGSVLLVNEQKVFKTKEELIESLFN